MAKQGLNSRSSKAEARVLTTVLSCFGAVLSLYGCAAKRPTGIFAAAVTKGYSQG